MPEREERIIKSFEKEKNTHFIYLFPEILNFDFIPHFILLGIWSITLIVCIYGSGLKLFSIRTQFVSFIIFLISLRAYAIKIRKRAVRKFVLQTIYEYDESVEEAKQKAEGRV